MRVRVRVLHACVCKGVACVCVCKGVACVRV